MSDRTNTIAGWVFFSGIVALGLSIGSGMYFGADKHHELENPGYPIEGAAEEGGADAGPSLAELLATGSAEAGEAVFQKCVSCHTVNQGGANGIGPNLHGIMGVTIGKHAAGFAYSGALSGHGGTWSFENMDAWLKSPKKFADGTKMSFAGLGTPADRANVMLYMLQNGGGPALPAVEAAPAAEAEGEAPAEGVEAEAAVEGAEAEAPAA